jgi:hypothetical protein
MEKVKTRKVHIDDLHFENKLWLKQLAFYKDELTIFQKRLDELALRNDKDSVIGIERFQNQLFIHNTNLEKLVRDIHRSETVILEAAQENIVAIDHRLFADHQTERKNMQTYERLFADYKREFYEFLGTWM